jgi:hypothetical protein
MNGQKRDLPLVLLTASAGLISALTAICLNFPIGRYAPLLSNRLGFGFIFLPGTVIGLVVWSCLAFRRYLHDPWKAIVISDAFGLSYYLSIWIAFTVELCSPLGRPGDEDALISKSALFAGGLAGTFMALGAVSVSMNSDIAWEHRMLTVLYWSLVGGILGVLGWTLGPFLGMALWSVIHPLGLTAPTDTSQNARGETSHRYSIWTVWQTGMGLLLGLVLHGYRANEVVPKARV